MNYAQAYEWLHGDRIEYSGCRSAAEAMSAELEALRKDAERYRWLRDPNNMRARELFRYYGDVDATELDAAIDAAMSTGATHE